MTFVDARKELGKLGVEITHFATSGYYRVNLRDASEATAYYTFEFARAVSVGKLMGLNSSLANFKCGELESFNFFNVSLSKASFSLYLSRLTEDEKADLCLALASEIHRLVNLQAL